MATFQPRTLGDVNVLGGSLTYQEALPMALRRANFADTLPHKKASILRKLELPRHEETSPTKSYDSFDSLSVVLDRIPQWLRKAGTLGIGAKGDFERLDHNMEGEISKAVARDLSTDKRTIAPAHVLANLIPVSAYVVQPSIEIIHAFLSRAHDVPLFIMTVAACMLDALSSEVFAKDWHITCPLTITFQPDINGIFGSYSRNGTILYLHDLPLKDRRVSPELIVLAALSLANAFSPNDRDHSDPYWIGHVARGRYTQAQLNATKRCILHDLDYALMPFTERSINRAMVREMAKLQNKLTELQVEQTMRDLGTWRSPSPQETQQGGPRLPNYHHPTVISASSCAVTSTSASLPPLPAPSPSSISLPSLSFSPASAPSSSAGVPALTQVNLQQHQAGLREEAGVEAGVEGWVEDVAEDGVED